MNYNPLLKLVSTQKNNQAIGIYSCCSANVFVLKAALKKAKEDNSCLLIESTANQVDQFGGYSGMTPKDFKDYVYGLAKEINYDTTKLFLGGDHLGPLTFAKYDEAKAMDLAKTLIHDYVYAGFTKIHLDTSMKVASDDPDTRLSDEIIAKRGAILAKVAEDAYQELLLKDPTAVAPVYVVGSEVPIPGGSIDAVDNGVEVTKVEDFEATYQTFKKEFEEAGLEEAFKRVIAMVVQPGVEEKDSGCTEYDRLKAQQLTSAIKKYPNIIFEGHSTDYQTKIKLKELVEDSVSILKVGPGLSFAAREGLFALAYAEKEFIKGTKLQASNLLEILDEKMLKEPKYWINHYHGNEHEIALKRKFSFSDRSRYYMPDVDVKQAINQLFNNFKNGVPLNLLSQFMPIQYTKVREGRLKNDPESLVIDRVVYTIEEYLYATCQKELF